MKPDRLTMGRTQWNTASHAAKHAWLKENIDTASPEDMVELIDRLYRLPSSQRPNRAGRQGQYARPKGAQPAL